MTKHEKNPNLFECSICQLKTEDKYQLYRHERLHQSTKEYRCVICNKFIEGFINVKLHQQSDHPLYATNVLGRRDFNCKLCPREHNTDSALRRHHLSVHAKIEHFQCTSCPAKFIENCLLQKHIKSAHNLAKPLPCWVCSKPFKDRFALNVHVNEAHELFAKNVLGGNELNLPSENSPDLTEEEEMPEKETSLGPENRSTFTKRIAVAGGKRSNVSGDLSDSEMSDLQVSDSTPDNFQAEDLSHEKMPKVTISSSISSSKSEAEKFGACTSEDQKPTFEIESFICIFCSEELQSETDLRNHHLEVHRNRFPFDCKICSRRFEDSNKLTSHFEEHNEVGNEIKPTETKSHKTVQKTGQKLSIKHQKEEYFSPKSKSEHLTTQRSLNCVKLKQALKVKTRNPRKANTNLQSKLQTVSHSAKSQPKSAVKQTRRTKSCLEPASGQVNPDRNEAKLYQELMKDLVKSNENTGSTEKSDEFVKATPTSFTVAADDVVDDDDDDIVILESTFPETYMSRSSLSCIYCQRAFPYGADHQLTLHYLSSHLGC